jgi:DNA-binding NtrC family response regulator
VLAEAFMRDCFAFTPGGPKAARKIRLYATASADLAELSREGRFRADLAMRLAVQPLRMPALHERRDDMLPLIDDVLARVSASLKRSIAGFTAEALQALQQQEWGDNIRGLRKAIQQAAMRTEGHVITLQDCALDETCQTNPPLARVQAGPVASVRRVLPSELSVSLTGTDRQLRPFDEIEADILRQALSHCDHHIGRAASALGIGRSTFYRKARDFGLLEGPDYSSGLPRQDSATATNPRLRPASPLPPAEPRAGAAA